MSETRTYHRNGHTYTVVTGTYLDGSRFEDRYRDGERHGIWRGWNPNGTLRYVRRLRDGELVER